MPGILKKSLGKRRQLFEIQDFSWCPKAVRDGVTDLLVLNLRIVPLYEPAIPILSRMAKSSEGAWVDLCAGAGGGSLYLKEKMPGEIKSLTLTDLYPHQSQSLPPGVTYFPESVDARKVPKNLPGMRTLFTSLHHMPDEVAKEILRDAMVTGTPIGAFEFTGRNLLTLLAVIPSFFFSFFLVPFLVPWRLSRFFWTYVIPLIPVVAYVDIIMSCFRTRNVDELKILVKDLNRSNYQWDIGTLPTYFGLEVTYISGCPTSQIRQV